jgi:hypothetical protein
VQDAGGDGVHAHLLPLALISLWCEQIFMQRARMVMNRIPNITWRGEIVDGIYFSCTKATMHKVEEEIRKLRHRSSKRRLGEPPVDDGEPILQVKTEQDGSMLPNKGQTVVDKYQPPPRKMSWTYVDETDAGLIDEMLLKSGSFNLRDTLSRRLGGSPVVSIIEEFVDLKPYDLPTDHLKKVAALPVVNRGGFVNGPPGVGKTLLISHIVAWIRQLYGEEVKIYKISELHTGARLMGGQTCKSLIRRKVYNKMHDAWIIMDESFQTHLEHWARISGVEAAQRQVRHRGRPVPDAPDRRRPQLHA